MYQIIKTEGGFSFESFREEDTFFLGKLLGEILPPGSILTLDGDLGVGKTIFTKGFADGLGITEPVTSPTFTIVQTYEEGRLPLYHFDVYRIADPMEMEEIGYEDMFFGQGITLIEWAVLIEDILPKTHICVRIEKDLTREFDYRKITVTGIPDPKVLGTILERSGILPD